LHKRLQISVVAALEFSLSVSFGQFLEKNPVHNFGFGFLMNAFDKCLSLLSRDMPGMSDCRDNE